MRGRMLRTAPATKAASGSESGTASGPRCGKTQGRQYCKANGHPARARNTRIDVNRHFPFSPFDSLNPAGLILRLTAILLVAGDRLQLIQ